MEVKKYIGKDETKVLNEALKDLNANLDEVIVASNTIKGGLFKGTSVELTVTPLTDILEFVKSYLKDCVTAMGLDVTFETKIRNRQLQIKMFSSDNPILIGKNGRTLASFQTIIRQVVINKFGASPYISLDVEDYKDRQMMHLEKTAKRIAKEVLETKVPVEMDNMNSYERRIVHNAVSQIEGITTESVGEEPNRHVVIKVKE